ncbi:thiamine-phosphate kinase [Marinilabilia rubra]|uniref:Thiamine-monophosphate kinase n=1 Tax=Marinilabilia rubra TaxID=2162893 RepID=A0A2U2BC31_9BACT|nr:thiamine-phosphate kinase [Marinilabilia rubra]PWE00634.1 thiamine-phosphate kinase [Marinilabilia rubra]
MKLSQIGEFGFIERFSKNFANIPTANSKGIGDDCAILPLDDKNEQVVTTDLLIEDIHFLRKAISPFDLGYKSLAVNLSDIAAMGAQPTSSFLSIAIPADMDVEYLDELMKGYHELSNKYNVPLLGGDTTRSPDKLVINVCVMGKTAKGKSRMRSMAQPDDIICVTGPLGDSAAGLKLILENIAVEGKSRDLLNWHNKPEPAINEGLWLNKQEGIKAMMDLSDGVASDLKHIMKQSQVGATIQLEDVPMSEALIYASEKYNWEPEALALAGGEDYRLMVTIDKTKSEKIITEYNKHFPYRLSPIGRITQAKNGEIEWIKKDRPFELTKEGFNHFGH